jgi:hypothetical protein
MTAGLLNFAEGLPKDRFQPEGLGRFAGQGGFDSFVEVEAESRVPEGGGQKQWKQSHGLGAIGRASAALRTVNSPLRRVNMQTTHGKGD